MRSIAVIIFVAIGLLLSPWVKASGTETRGGDETPNCATHNEYDRIHGFMYPETVAEVVGNDGWFIDTANPDSFARGYRSCWAPGERFVKVWFEIPSRFSYRKDIVDVSNGRSYQSTSLMRTAPLTAVAGPGRPGHWDNTCFGKRVTLRGSYTGDTLQGTDGRDVIFAYAGNDVITAGNGNDRICGRWGADIINAGAGYDRVGGGGDFDLCLFGEVNRHCP